MPPGIRPGPGTQGPRRNFISPRDTSVPPTFFQQVAPDRIDRPFFLAHEQLAVTEVSPKPEETIRLDWEGDWPDFAQRAALPVANDPFFATSPKPEDRLQLDWEGRFPDALSKAGPRISESFFVSLLPPAAALTEQFVVYPDKIDRTRFLEGFVVRPLTERTSALLSETFPDRIDRPSFREGLAVLPLKPEEKIQLDWHPEHPDWLSRLFLSAADSQSFSTSPFPERASALVSEVFPDRIDRSLFRETFVSLPPIQPVAATLTEWFPEYPDELIQPKLSPTWFTTLPGPERTAVLVSVVWPDRIDRPGFREGWFSLPTSPERTATLVSEAWPDRIDRPSFREGWTVLPLKSEEKVQLDWGPDYPDRALRSAFLTADQAFFSLAPFPERSSQMFGETFPDRIDRPAFREGWSVLPLREERVQLDWCGEQPDRALRAAISISEIPSFSLAPFPDRTSSIADQVHPDRIDRPSFREGWAVLPLKAEERIQLDWNPNYPDRASRSVISTSEIPAFSFAPFPERTATLPSESFPDRVDRPALRDGWSVLPLREERVQLDWGPVYPDRVVRDFIRFPLFVLAPFPDRTSAIVSATYPDRIDRPSFREGWAVLPMNPEDRVQLDWGPNYPDRALRPAFLTADQTFFSLAPFPERTSALLSEAWPDRIDRPSFREGMAVLPLKAEEKIQLDWGPGYPDRVIRDFIRFPLFVLAPFPERTSPLVSETYPDRIDRPWFRDGLSTLPPRPEEKIQLDWQPDYPDRATRDFLRAPIFAFAPAPERTSALALPIFSDAVRGAFFGTYEQFVTAGVKPEDKVQLDWSSEYPDRATRAWLPVAHDLAFAFAPKPERSAILVDQIHPDRIDRSSFREGWDVLPLKVEERIQLDWSPNYPDRAIRRVLPTSSIPAFTFAPEPERKSPMASEVHPDLVRGIFFLAAEQLAAVSPRTEEKVQLDWSPDCPDRALRAFLTVANSPAFSFAPAPERTQFFGATHPDWLEGRKFRTYDQHALIKPEETVELDWSSEYPDRTISASPAHGPSFALAPQPERSVFFGSLYPELVAGRFYSLSDQLVLVRSENAEFWGAVYPDIVAGAPQTDPMITDRFATHPFPPPVPPRPKVVLLPIPRAQTGGGGARHYWPQRQEEKRPAWEPPLPKEQAPVEKRQETALVPFEKKAEEADYAVLPVGEEVAIRALVDGRMQHFVDVKAGPSILVVDNVGTRFIYANVGRYVGTPRYVRAGEIIAYTPRGRFSPPTVEPSLLSVWTPASPIQKQVPVEPPSTWIKPWMLIAVLTGAIVTAGVFIGVAIKKSKAPTRAVRGRSKSSLRRGHRKTTRRGR